MPVSLEDSRLFQDEISRFVQQRMLPETTHHEQPMAASTFHALADELTAIGVLPDFSHEPTGLWADMNDAATSTLSLNLLRTLGHANASLALTLHRQALTRFLLQQLNWRTSEQTTMLLTGHYGLARTSLGRYLAGVPLKSDDQMLLADWLDPAHERILTHTDAFAQLIYPVWDNDGIQWQLAARDQLEQSPQTAHGLDELSLSTIKVTAQPIASTELNNDVARTLYSQLFKAELLGLTAIGLGVLERSSLLATDYSRLRRQGGAIIQQHAAVQLMLSDIHISIQQARLLLESSQSSIHELAISQAASIRLVLSEQLVHACHQVIQIHGGIGYMRDTGPEKYMREQNMLRLQSGGVAGLGLLIQGAEQ